MLVWPPIGFHGTPRFLYKVPSIYWSVPARPSHPSLPQNHGHWSPLYALFQTRQYTDCHDPHHHRHHVVLLAAPDRTAPWS
jgi:hypothetical protein